MIKIIIQQLEVSLSDLLAANKGYSIYLISLSGDVDGRSSGRWGIGIHFEDSSCPGAVRHETLINDQIPNDSLSWELAYMLTEWVRQINTRLKVPREPRIEVGLTG